MDLLRSLLPDATIVAQCHSDEGPGVMYSHSLSMCTSLFLPYFSQLCSHNYSPILPITRHFLGLSTCYSEYVARNMQGSLKEDPRLKVSSDRGSLKPYYEGLPVCSSLQPYYQQLNQISDTHGSLPVALHLT